MISEEQLEKGIRILIVDDHPVVRQGLKGMLELDPRFRVAQEAGGVSEAMKIIQEEAPDFAIFDITLGKGSGLELIKDVRAFDYEFPILVMSMHEESLYAERVLKAGGNGYIMKKELSNNLVTAIERLCKGKIYVSQDMHDVFLEKAAGIQETRGGIHLLSDRELEVFQQLGSGQTTRQIAENLHLSVKTIETYRAHIKDKLGLKNAAELVTTAARWMEQSEG